MFLDSVLDKVNGLNFDYTVFKGSNVYPCYLHHVVRYVSEKFSLLITARGVKLTEFFNLKSFAIKILSSGYNF